MVQNIGATDCIIKSPTWQHNLLATNVEKDGTCILPKKKICKQIPKSTTANHLSTSNILPTTNPPITNSKSVKRKLQNEVEVTLDQDELSNISPY